MVQSQLLAGLVWPGFLTPKHYVKDHRDKNNKLTPHHPHTHLPTRSRVYRLTQCQIFQVRENTGEITLLLRPQASRARGLVNPRGTPATSWGWSDNKEQDGGIGWWSAEETCREQEVKPTWLCPITWEISLSILCSDELPTICCSTFVQFILYFTNSKQEYTSLFIQNNR